MRTFGALALVFLTPASGAQIFPPPPDDSELIDSQVEMARLGSPTGTWEGWAEPIYDMAGINNGGRDRFKLRLVIRIQSAEIYVTEPNGEERILGGITYKHEVDNTVLLSYVLAANGFVEYQSIALAQIEPDKLQGSVTRLVHNLVIGNKSPWRMIPNYSVVTLERVG